MAVLDLPADPGGQRPDLLQACRHDRAQAADPARDRTVPDRLGAVRARVVDAGADRVPGLAGSGCRRGPADVDHHRRRHLHAGRAGPRPGLHRERVGPGFGDRADARRAVQRVPRLAVDLLRQRAARADRRDAAGAPLPRDGRAPQPPGRLAGRRAAHGRPEPGDPRDARGRERVGVGRPAEPRLLRARPGAAGGVRRRRTPRRRARTAHLGAVPPAARDHGRGRGRRRDAADGRDHLRADVPRGDGRGDPAGLGPGARERSRSAGRCPPPRWAGCTCAWGSAGR